MFGQPAPWGGLPQQAQPWSGGAQWEAAQQAPWRMSPWQTQGMPSGAPMQQPPMLPQMLLQGLLSQGTSQGLQDFQPMQPGGGFYPGLLGGQQQQMPQQRPMQSFNPNQHLNYDWGVGTADRMNLRQANNIQNQGMSTYNAARMRRLQQQNPFGGMQ